MGSTIGALLRETAIKGAEVLADLNRKRLAAPIDGSPFLTGIHAPMTEELTLIDLEVHGQIPAGLAGRYLRIGPNPIQPDGASYHWFIGDGMIHGIAIEDGKALWYRNRWIRSTAVAQALDIEPAPGPRHRFDTVNTNIIGIGSRTYALVEAGSFPVEVDETLEAQAYNSFDGTLPGSFSAHPHLDPATGENHAICYDGTDPNTVRHVVVNASGKVIREEPIAVKHGPMIHDCAITDRFVVILDLPVTFSLRTLVAGHSFPYRWNPEHEARIGLMPRHGGQDDIIWCPVPPSFAFHVANAYDEDDGKVVLDLCVYDTMFNEGAQGPDARSRGLERWIINPATKAVEVRSIDKAPQDFPRIDERFFGQRHRYAWGMTTPTEQTNRFIGATAIIAHDLHSGTQQIHDFGTDRYPGEFVFVPEAPESAEGEGWLIGLVVDMATETTELVILDARRFCEMPVASILLPHRIPPGFHGNWLHGIRHSRSGFTTKLDGGLGRAAFQEKLHDDHRSPP